MVCQSLLGKAMITLREVHGSVKTGLKVKYSYRTRGEVHSRGTAGEKICQVQVRGAKQFQ